MRPDVFQEAASVGTIFISDVGVTGSETPDIWIAQLPWVTVFNVLAARPQAMCTVLSRCGERLSGPAAIERLHNSTNMEINNNDEKSYCLFIHHHIMCSCGLGSLVAIDDQNDVAVKFQKVGGETPSRVYSFVQMQRKAARPQQQLKDSTIPPPWK